MPDRSPYTLILPSRAHRGGARLHCVLRDAPSLTHAAGVSARPADEPADRGDVDRELRRHGALRLSDPGEHDTHPDDDLVLGSRGVRVHLCRGSTDSTSRSVGRSGGDCGSRCSQEPRAEQLAHALDVCKTENQTRDTTHGGARWKGSLPVCRKRPFAIHADRLRPRSQKRRAPSRWTCSATPCGPRASTPVTATRVS